jgi:hypothetical protein
MGKGDFSHSNAKGASQQSSDFALHKNTMEKQ